MPTSKPNLRFLCFGAGAIGTYIGGSLALSGQDVVFLERADVALDLMERGLRLGLNGAEHRIPNPVIVDSLDQALNKGPFDVAILAVKAFDTATIIESLLPYKVALPVILCLQNGVENEPLLADAFGPEKVIAGTVTSAIGRRGAGDIVLERLRGMGVAGGHVLSPLIVDVLKQAGLRAHLYRSAASMKWSKMLTNLLANASSAILDMSPAEIFNDPSLFRMEVCQIREILAVMNAQSIPLTDLPGTPVRLLAWMMNYLPVQLSQPLMRQTLGKGRGAKMPSFHIDLYAGRGKSEVDYLNGAVVRYGKRFGVAVLVNQLLNQTLLALTSGELSLDTYRRNPAKLLSQLE